MTVSVQVVSHWSSPRQAGSLEFLDKLSGFKILALTSEFQNTFLANERYASGSRPGTRSTSLEMSI